MTNVNENISLENISSDNISLENTLEIIKMQHFKQEINEKIDTYISDLQKNSTGKINNKRLLTHVVTYYERMKNIYECQKESDDENDDKNNPFMDDESDTVLSDTDDNDYAKIFENKIYVNNSSQREKEIRDKILGMDNTSNDDKFYNRLNRTILTQTQNIGDKNIVENGDSSVDENMYSLGKIISDDENNANDESEKESDNETFDEVYDPVINNKKSVFKTLKPDIEIIVDDNNADDDDYNEPI